MQPAEGRSLRGALTEVALIAVGYYVAGRLGLLLAIPPGYATAVWPPAGIALVALLFFGYRAWPGVWLGSFSVNVGVSFDFSSPEAIRKSILIAAVIATGAALQAVAGAWLVRRHVGFPTALDNARDVVKFLLLGAPIGCLVNATWSVTGLFWAGAIPSANYFFSWWTWWAGDAIGVLVIAPLILIFISTDPVWRRRRLAVAMPSIGLYGIFIAVFIAASSSEQKHIDLELKRQASQVSILVENSLTGHLDMLHSIAGLYAVSSQVDQQRFHTFTEQWLQRHTGIRAVGWNPRVADSDRARFEQAMREDGHPGFQITERTPDGRLVRAAERPEYIPVAYIEPYAGNEAALGFDVSSNRDRLDTLNQARDTATPVATGRIRLVQETGGQFGVLIFMPVYGSGLPTRTVDERRRSLLGFVTGVFRIQDVFQKVAAELDKVGIAVVVEDAAASQDERLLFGQPDGSAGGPEALRSAAMQWHRTLDMAGRAWTLKFFATPQALKAQRSLQAWTLLASGLLFTGLLGAFLLVVTGYTSQVEATVTERTAELAREVEEHKRTEAKLLVAKESAEAATHAKSAFLANISHELRTPLHAIIGYSELLQEELTDVNQLHFVEDLERIRTSGRHLLSLINDILDLSKVEAGRMEVVVETFAVSKLIEDVAATVRPLLEKNKNRLEIRLTDTLGDMRSDPVRLRQVLFNVLSNAAKFTDRGTVTIHADRKRFDESDWIYLSVTDTGIGMTPEQVASLFQAFSQADGTIARQYGGTGLGLALSRNFCRLMRGDIDVRSEAGRGTTFVIRLPAELVVG